MKNKAIYAKLDALTESAMKETIRTAILESTAIDSNSKINGINMLENKQFSKEYVLDFMRSKIRPIIETAGLNNFDKMIYNPKKSNVKGVFLPVYEVALTLEAAKWGQLTEDSLDAVFAPNTIDELPADVEVVQDVVKDPINEPLDSPVKNDQVNECGCEGDAKELVNVDQFENNDMPTLDNTASDEEKNVSERYIYDRFGRVIMVEDTETNDAGLSDANFEQGKATEKSEYTEPDPVEPEFKKDTDIKPYDPGHPAVGADQGLFAPYTEMAKLNSLAKYLFEDGVDLTATTDETEVEQTSDENLKTYSGNQGGIPGTTSEEGQFAASAPGDEMAVAESQVILARELIGRIFKEYGIVNTTIKKSIVCEAIHYLTKYGINSLYPSVPDVTDLVISQTKLAEANLGYTPALICEATNVNYLTEVLSQKEMKRFAAIAKAKTSKKGSKTAGGAKAVKGHRNTLGKMVYSESIDNALNVAQTLAEGVEIERQIFRSRMAAFSESVKKEVAAKWTFNETAKSQAAIELIPVATVRNYVTENADLKEFFKQIGKDSPVASRVFFRTNASSNDALVTSVLMNEAVAMAKSICAPCSKTQKVNECYTYAKKVMVENLITHINLCDSMHNPTVAINEIRDLASKINKNMVVLL